MTHTAGIKNTSIYAATTAFLASSALIAVVLTQTPPAQKQPSNTPLKAAPQTAPIDVPSRYLMTALDFSDNARLTELSYRDICSLKRDQNLTLEGVDEIGLTTEAVVTRRACTTATATADLHLIRGDGDTYVRISRSAHSTKLTMEDIERPVRPETDPCTANPRLCSDTIQDIKNIIG